MQRIYFVTTSLEKCKKGDDSNQIDIKQYDPVMNSVITLLTLRVDKILAFTQLKDGRFIIINDDGEILIYEKNKAGLKLMKAG